MARRGRGGGVREKKRKRVPYKLIERMHAGKVVEVYRILEKVVKDHHGHLAEAKIVLAWHEGWRADTDGRVKLGMAKKCSDLDKELHEHDFIIILNQEAWGDLDDTGKRALMHHELCHCQRVMDTDGQQKIDDRGRPCWRIRKHDIEEFREVVATYGCYKEDLVEFVEAARSRRAEPLFGQNSANGKPAPAAKQA